MRRLFPAAAVAALLAAAPARAGFMAATVVDTNGLIGQQGTIGWGFTPTADLTVTALGVFDYHADGLKTAHQVAIWDAASRAVVAAATVPVGTAGTLADGFRYEAAAGSLQAGRLYVIGALFPADPTTSPDADEMAQYGSSTIAIDGHIALEDPGRGRVAFGGGALALPPLDVLPPAFGANFQFDLAAAPSAAPAPPAVVLLGSGALTLCGYGWRRRKAAAAAAV
ncbi:MAG TPA: hypothetical protein VGF55_32530 [Gemmataceae bacterium]|jgi:hypothetical protein